MTTSREVWTPDATLSRDLGGFCRVVTCINPQQSTVSFGCIPQSFILSHFIVRIFINLRRRFSRAGSFLLYIPCSLALASIPITSASFFALLKPIYQLLLEQWLQPSGSLAFLPPLPPKPLHHVPMELSYTLEEPKAMLKSAISDIPHPTYVSLTYPKTTLPSNNSLLLGPGQLAKFRSQGQRHVQHRHASVPNQHDHRKLQRHPRCRTRPGYPGYRGRRI